MADTNVAVGFSSAQLADLEAKYEDIGRLKSRDDGRAWEVVFRRPRRSEFKTFRQRAHNPATKAEAQETLARACVVATFYRGVATIDADKARTEFDAMLDRYPAICDSEAASSLFERLMSGAVDASGE